MALDDSKTRVPARDISLPDLTDDASRAKARTIGANESFSRENIGLFRGGDRSAGTLDLVTKDALAPMHLGGDAGSCACCAGAQVDDESFPAPRKTSNSVKHTANGAEKRQTVESKSDRDSERSAHRVPERVKISELKARNNDAEKPSFKFAEDGSATYKVRSGDTIMKISRDALVKASGTAGTKPSDAMALEAADRIATHNGLPDINKIKPDMELLIPRDVIGSTRAPKDRVPVPGSRIVESAGASAEFADKMKQHVEKLPPEIRRLLEDGGVKVVVVGEMADYDPNLARAKPRGWPPGSTWAQADGLCNGTTVVVAENTRNVFGRLEKSDRTVGVVNHEIGHAVDNVLGDFSHSPAFTAAYEQDLARIPAADVSSHDYLLQGRGDRANFAGREEAFAEALAALRGASANPSDTLQIRRNFGKSSEVISKRLEVLRAEQTQSDVVKAALAATRLMRRDTVQVAVDEKSLRRLSAQ